jgi:hypothetical protein
LMATGGSARQVRDNLALNAGHFLEDAASIKYKSDIPTERWFSLQREALGVRPSPNSFYCCRSGIPQQVRKATHHAQNCRRVHGRLPGTTH